jgi:dTDP-4-dehydrorhamnose 3,5-epimerase
VPAVRRLETRLEGPILIEPVVHGDKRGFFQETYRHNVFAELGIPDDWVQHNHSRSRRGVLRGMHFQAGMAKLVRCVHGSIFDVVVDIRPESRTFGRWEAFALDDETHHQVYCPERFAHGFCVLSDVADVVYLCSTYHVPEHEGGFRWDDPDVAIDWPSGIEFETSARDREAPLLAELGLRAPA